MDSAHQNDDHISGSGVRESMGCEHEMRDYDHGLRNVGRVLESDDHGFEDNRE